MSFDVKIKFRGLLHFVENKSREESFKLAIVCPELKGHHGRTRVGSHRIAINGARVFLRFNRAEGKGELNYREGALDGEIKGAVPLDLIAGSSSLSESIFNRKPEGVSAQIFLEEGTFETSASEGFPVITWDLPADLTGAPQKIKVAQEFFASIQGVESGFLVMEPFNGGLPSVFPLVGLEGQTLELDLSYFCERNLDEVLAELTATNGLLQDDDFRAHYGLLGREALAGIDKKLAQRGRRARRPVPKRQLSEDELNLLRAGTSGEGVNPTGCLCLCSGGGALRFSVDSAFQSALERATGAGSMESLPEAQGKNQGTDQPGFSSTDPIQGIVTPFRPARGFTQEQLDDAYEEALARYGNRPDVTAVDVGYRYKSNRRMDELAVRVHVREKLPESALEAADVLPQAILGVPLDVIPAVYHAQLAVAAVPVSESFNRMTRANVIQPGLSISHETAARSTGTFGALVYDRRTGRRCILSNWHVLAGSVASIRGDSIIQPGRGDFGSAPGDTVAHLERMMLDQDGDAAIAVLNEARGVRAEQLETNVLVQQVGKPRIGDIVTKSGRSTDVTHGKVDGIGRYKVGYAVIGEVPIDGFKIVPEVDGNPNNLEVSRGGDSGALWYGGSGQQGLGLHFAGEVSTDPLKEHAIACHLDRVLEKLDISLVPVQPTQVQPTQAMVAAAEGLSSQGPAAEIRLLVETTARLARMVEQGFGKRE